MSEEAKALVEGIYKVMNTGDMSNLDSVIDKNVIDHEDIPGIEGTGDEKFRQFIQMFRGAFPDLHIQAHDIVAEGDRIAVRATLSGTHRGEFMGMPASGKSFSVQLFDMIRVGNGKCVEHWGVADQLGMMQQLGAIPSQ